MRWPVFIALTFLVGLVQMAMRPHLALPAIDIHLELLFLIAFSTGLRCRRSYVPVTFWWCGLMQDLFLGHRLGANALLYLLPALLLSLVRGRVLEKHMLTRLGLVLGLLCLTLLLRPILEWRIPQDLASFASLRMLVGSAACSAILSPLAGLLLRWSLLRPWRQEGPAYGLPGVV